MATDTGNANAAGYFLKVKEMLAELGYAITTEDVQESMVIINDEDAGISNMILDCEDTVLIAEQVIFETSGDDPKLFRRLLQLNRNFIHGAFVLDEEGKRVIYRDTLQLENLDLNELEATLNSLSLFLAEHSAEIIDMSKG